MLTVSSSDEKQSSCFKFIGADSTSVSEGGVDTCSFYSGPSDAAIMAFGESCETSGSIAYAGTETSGSIAYAGGGESCGAIASSSVSASFGGGFSGGGCSYSC